MKISTLILLMAIMGISGCSSQKKLVEEAPFEVGDAYCTPVIGGREESGTGFKLEIPINRSGAQGITFDEVYFRGKVLASEAFVEGDEYVLRCAYNKPVGKPDIVMSSDPYDEVGNQPPSLKKESERKFPFTLETDEAVLSYILPGSSKVNYVKIGGIKDKPARVLPSKPTQ